MEWEESEHPVCDEDGGHKRMLHYLFTNIVTQLLFLLHWYLIQKSSCLCVIPDYLRHAPCLRMVKPDYEICAKKYQDTISRVTQMEHRGMVNGTDDDDTVGIVCWWVRECYILGFLNEKWFWNDFICGIVPSVSIWIAQRGQHGEFVVRKQQHS